MRLLRLRHELPSQQSSLELNLTRRILPGSPPKFRTPPSWQETLGEEFILTCASKYTAIAIYDGEVNAKHTCGEIMVR